MRVRGFRPKWWARTRDRIGSVLLCGLVAALCAVPTAAVADDLAELGSEKTYWQNRYRNLLAEASELRATIEVERELYADANRRNYRRGRKRSRHLEKVQKATAELITVETALATIEDDGRRAGALPGWFYEVEIEIESAKRRPAVSIGPGEEGRNPLYQKKRSTKNYKKLQ